MASLLDALIAPLSRPDFLATFPGEARVTHGDLSRFAPLLEMPELASVHALARVFHDPVTVYFRNDPSGQSSTGELVRAPESLAGYEAGALLQFNSVERWVPALDPLLRSLEEELALPAGTATCQLFASTVGAGAVPHWDNDPAFTVQLRGEKTWRLARSPAVPEPLHNYACGSHRVQLAAYYDGPLPQAMPEDAREITAAPGSVLFVPRGFLHQTESHAHSFAITFDFVMPTWCDVVRAHVARELNQHARWRRLAPGLGGDDPAAPARELAAMIDDLARIVDALRASPERAVASINPSLVPRAGRRFERTGARAEGARAGTGEHAVYRVRVAAAPHGEVELDLSPDFEPLCGWLLAQRGAVSEREVLRHAAGLQRVDVGTLLSTLLDVGVLAPARAPRAEAAPREPQA
ncbi:cupin domain-containing protein [Sorangium sp. So ce321]|uniref:JmjC domain-containing protein n=1 Tax=Sorangium sp. So ce321 TaxID=3133300 RepID=UPI003F62EAED